MLFRTLRLWDEAFRANEKQIAQLGFDDCFMRKWHYYFCYCEAGFATRTIGDVHLVLTRPVNMALSEGILP